MNDPCLFIANLNSEELFLSCFRNLILWVYGNLEPKRSNIELKQIIVELKKFNSKRA